MLLTRAQAHADSLSDEAFRAGLARVAAPGWADEAESGWPFGPSAIALPLPGGAVLVADGVPVAEPLLGTPWGALLGGEDEEVQGQMA